MASAFALGVCFSILGDIWEGVKELVEAVWDSAREAFWGSDIADLEGGTALEEIAKALKKILAGLKKVFNSDAWYFFVAPYILAALIAAIMPAYGIIQGIVALILWPFPFDFSFSELFRVIFLLITYSWTNLGAREQMSLRRLFFVYFIWGTFIFLTKFSLFFLLLVIKLKRFFLNPKTR